MSAALKMKFGMPAGCRNEVFTTARLGKKWQTRVAAAMSNGEKVVKVSMVDGDGNSIGSADVIDMWVGPLGAVPAVMLEAEHDPICRTYSGLQAVLQSTYDKPIGHEEEITVIRLKYTGSLIQLATASDVPPAADSFGGN